MMIKSMLEIDHYSPNQNFITSAQKKKNPKGPKKKKYMKIILILQSLEPQSLHIIFVMLMEALLGQLLISYYKKFFYITFMKNIKNCQKN